MDDTARNALLSAVRTLLGALGGFLVTKGIIDSSTMQDVVGAIMVIIPVVWGAWDKYRAERATKEREKAAVQAGVVAERTNQLRGVAAKDITHEHAQEIIHGTMRDGL
jgi:hypothetical protein